MSDNVALISLMSNLQAFQKSLDGTKKAYSALKNKETPYAYEMSFLIGYYSLIVEMTKDGIKKLEAKS